MVAATLSSLPTEIKTKIATLCHEQDRDFKTLLQRIQTRRDVDSDTFLIRELAIPTLTALSVLSHEWNVLTAPIRFQSLTARQIDTGLFRLLIGPKHAVHIKRVDLQYLNTASFSSVLSWLAAMPNVRHVDLPDPTAIENSIKKDLSTSDRSRVTPSMLQSATSQLGSWLRQVASVSAQGPDAFVNTCASSTALRSLAVVCFGVDQIRSLQRVTAKQYPNLVRLDISTGASIRLAEPGLLAAWTDCPRLKRLAFQTTVDVFNKALSGIPAVRAVESLRIDLGTSIDMHSNPTFSSDFRPDKLLKLEIRAEHHNTTALIDSIDPDQFPRLQHLHLENGHDGGYELSTIYEELSALVRRFHEVRRQLTVTCDLLPAAHAVRLDPSFFPPPIFDEDEDTSDLEEEEIMPRIAARAMDWPRERIERDPARRTLGLLEHDTRSRRRTALMSDDKRDEVIRDEFGEPIDAVLDSITSMTAQARRTRDVAHLTRIARALRYCEYLRIEHEA